MWAPAPAVTAAGLLGLPARTYRWRLAAGVTRRSGLHGGLGRG
jgi:hypothetical protein